MMPHHGQPESFVGRPSVEKRVEYWALDLFQDSAVIVRYHDTNPVDSAGHILVGDKLRHWNVNFASSHTDALSP